MIKEIWKVYKDTRYAKHGFLWEVSDQGNVKKNGVLFECRLDRGYKVFGPCYGVHRAVAQLFIPNPNNKPEVDHINGDRLDNKAINLRWVTHKENSNNPITRKRISESKKGNQNVKGKIQSEEHRRKNSESHKNKHRVYHDDGTYHYEKNTINNK